MGALISALAGTIGSIIAGFTSWLVSTGYYFIGWAWHFIVESCRSVIDLALQQLISFFPTFGNYDYFEQLLTYLEYANYWLPLSEALTLVVSMFAWRSVYIAFRFVLKLIPFVG